MNLKKGNKHIGESNYLLHPASAAKYQSSSVPNSEHLGKHRQYWRDIILGVNDGLVSTFLLVTGVYGGGLSSKEIFLTAMSGALAGSVSMFAGEFIATRSQDQVLEGEIKLENAHIENHHEDEVNELPALFDLIGIPGENEDGEHGDLRERLTRFYSSDRKALLQIMIALEFGVLEKERRSPLVAGLTSCGLFFLGSFPSIIAFAISHSPTEGLIVAIVLTFLSLMSVGAIKAFATRDESCLRSALENLVIAGFGGILAYSSGVYLQRLIDAFLLTYQ